MTTWKTVATALLLGLTLTACGGNRPEVNEQTNQWVDSLIRDLGDPCPGTRLTAARALATPMATRAIPALTQALHDSDCDVRCAAYNALVKIGPAQSNPVILALQVRHD